MHARSLRGNREISSLTVGGGMRQRPASGRRGAEADDVRTGEVRLTDSTDEVGEQDGHARCGADGGKRWDREECGRAKHGPDSVPAKPCPRRAPAYVEPLTPTPRHPLAIGAVCGNSARTDLCGGHPVMGVPTAIIGQNRPLRFRENHVRAPHVLRRDYPQAAAPLGLNDLTEVRLPESGAQVSFRLL